MNMNRYIHGNLDKSRNMYFGSYKNRLHHMNRCSFRCSPNHNEMNQTVW